MGITADRRAGEQAELLRRRGAVVVHGPSIATRYLGCDSVLRQATVDLVARPPDYLVATTGIGVRAWLETAQSWGVEDALLDALSRVRVLARGPKAVAALQTGGIDVWYRSSTERVDDLIEHLGREPLVGRRVAVQEYGSTSPELSEALSSAGAMVELVPVYQWAMPEDIEPARRLIEAACNRRLDAVTFTSAPAVTNLFAIAEDQSMALRQAFNDGVVAACVGPVCAQAALRLGVDQPIQPTLGRLGLLVRVLSEHFEGQRRTFVTPYGELVAQGSAISVAGTVVDLSARERQVFDVLAARPRVVVAASVLLSRIWGQDSDPHRVEVTVGRLRRRLGTCGRSIETRAGRGYFLDAEERVSLSA